MRRPSNGVDGGLVLGERMSLNPLVRPPPFLPYDHTAIVATGREHGAKLGVSPRDLPDRALVPAQGGQLLVRGATDADYLYGVVRGGRRDALPVVIHGDIVHHVLVPGFNVVGRHLANGLKLARPNLVKSCYDLRLVFLPGS